MPTTNELVLMCDRNLQSTAELKANAVKLGQLENEIRARKPPSPACKQRSPRPKLWQPRSKRSIRGFEPSGRSLPILNQASPGSTNSTAASMRICAR
jgi:hypothetical protein